MATADEVRRFKELVRNWNMYRASLPEPDRYEQIRIDLKQVRNPGWQGNPPLSSWPTNLIDSDSAMVAAVEHYFVCRSWVGSGKFPAWQMLTMSAVYDLGKMVGASPRHNPKQPTTQLTSLQMWAQAEGVRDGGNDLKISGRSAPPVAMPPRY